MEIIGYSVWPTHIGYYYWWIFDPEAGVYYLYQFKSVQFIQGLITILNACGANFQDYIFGLPFTVATEGRIGYDLYDIDGIHINTDEFAVLMDRATQKYQH